MLTVKEAAKKMGISENHLRLLLLKGAIKGKKHGWCLALTFAIYVFYDLANFFDLGIEKAFLSVIFFIATISILWFVWREYNE